MSLLHMKEIARVGKNTLKIMAGVPTKLVEKEEAMKNRVSTCPKDCYFNNVDDNMLQVMGLSCCPHHAPLMESSDALYVSENNEGEAEYTEQALNRLSKLQFLQLLSYHFMDVDKYGLVKYISARELADTLKCTVRSIKDNNKRLSELGLIGTHKVTSDIFGLFIMGYDKIQNSKKHGGSGGYVQISKSFFDSLLTIDNVNSMRLAINAFLKFDEEAYAQGKESYNYFYKGIKESMPSNINHKKIIDKLFMKTKDLFEIVPQERSIQIVLKEEHNGKMQRKKKIGQYAEIISDYMKTLEIELITREKNKHNLNSTVYENLAGLALEYGVPSVCNALDSYAEYLNSDLTDEKVKNIGGFIRNTIKYKFEEKVYQKLA